MQRIYLLIILFIITSCGGGGGAGAPAVPFSLTLAPNSFAVNEDDTYDGSIQASTNEVVTLTYAITSEPTNGTLTLSGDGDIIYSPNNNFNGSDQFNYSVNVAEKNITRNADVAITVNPVNDSPTISMDTLATLNKDNLIFESNPSFNITFADIDNEFIDLAFSAKVDDVSVPAVFSSISDGYGSIELDLSNLTKSGYLEGQLIISDGSSVMSENSKAKFNTWFIANKRTITINQDDDPEDGVTVGSRSDKDYYVYDLIGGSSSIAGTKWLFVADALEDNDDIESFREALLESVNKLSESDASSFFAGYFDIVVAEPVTPDGTSPAGVRTGCYDYDEDVYCIGSADIDTSVFQVLLSDNDLISVLTKTVNPDSGVGRGVNLGNRNIQPIGTRTATTVVHELGHAHGEMGDEYRTDDDRDVSDYADLNINTTTQNDISLLKWKHHIDDETNVLGKDILVCYNYGDGTIGDWDNRGITVDQCGCFANEWSSTPNSNGQYSFIRKNPECAGVGLFEGNYYGLDDNYRPTFCSVMDSCSSGGYGKVNVEGFAIGSVMNQGFYLDDSDAQFVSNTGSTSNDGFEIVLNAKFDESKIKLEWYVDGIQDNNKTNQTTVTFPRPTNKSIEIYTWRAVDLTGFIVAPDSITNDDDFYEGLFNLSCFRWIDDDSNRVCDPSDKSSYNYGYMYSTMGGKWGINWSKY